MNATMSYYFITIGMKAIYVLYNKICATIALVMRLPNHDNSTLWSVSCINLLRPVQWMKIIFVFITV